MTYLLDSCILSALRKIKAHPQPKLLSWFKAHPSSDYFISSITVGEIERGIAKLSADHPAKMALENWFHGELLPQFADRILSLDKVAAMRWGRICAECEKRGKTLPICDGQIAAIADQNNLIVVTFNTKDFCGVVECIDPRFCT